MRRLVRDVWILGVAIALICGPGAARAQDLEPRAYSANPIGTNFLILDYGHSAGDVGVDPSLPITNVEATLDVGKLGYTHSFDLGGHMATYGIVVPYATGTATGQVFEQSTQISRAGLANVGLRFAMNLAGCPALTPAQFAQRKPTTTIGVSLAIATPTGAYDPAHLINIGTNRWTFRPEIGIEHPMGRWFLDAAGGALFFTTNTDYFGGRTLSQAPMPEVQVHPGYNFGPGFWLAADVNYYWGGQTSLDRAPTPIRYANSRYGLSFAHPLGKGFSTKLAWSSWFSGRYGSQFHTAELAVQYRWFDR